MSATAGETPLAIREVPIEPTFIRALAGLWRLTWRAQMTLRRLPILLFLLFCVPVLTFITLDPAGRLKANHEPVLSPVDRQMKAFEIDLARKRMLLSTERKALVRDALAAEFAKTDLGRLEEKRPLSQIVEELNSYHQRVLAKGKQIFSLTEFNYQTVLYESQKRELADAIQRAKLNQLSDVTPFYRWLINFYFLMVLPISCLASCGAMIRDELQGDTLGFLLTRPLSRGKLLLAKFLTHFVWIELLLLAETGLMFLAGYLRHVPGLGSLFLLVVGIQVLVVAGWAALATMFGLLARRYMVIGLVYGFIVELGLERIPTNINSLSMTRHIKTLLSHHDQVDSVYEWSAAPFHFTLGTWTPNPTVFALVCVVVMAVVFLGCSVALFTFREYNYGEEMQ
jgi:ABC-type transport system involved in multi-copper enzyme maturation permease subunit